MSLSGVNPDIDDVPSPARPEPEPGDRARGRWSVPGPFRLPLTGVLIYLGIRLISVATTGSGRENTGCGTGRCSGG